MHLLLLCAAYPDLTRSHKLTHLGMSIFGRSLCFILLFLCVLTLPCMFHNRIKHDSLFYFSASQRFSLFLPPVSWQCADTVKRNYIWLISENRKNSPSFAAVTAFPWHCLCPLPYYRTLQLLHEETLSLESYCYYYYYSFQDLLSKQIQNQMQTEVFLDLGEIVLE